MPPDKPTQARPAAAAFAADVVCVVLFATIGRRSHAEGLTITGIAETAWPFVSGAVVGWLLSTGWRRPLTLLPTGVVVWVCTVALGMLLRRLTSAGTASSFIVVASLSTAVLLLGWRAAVGRLRRR
jgi:hypothetical protein